MKRMKKRIFAMMLTLVTIFTMSGNVLATEVSEPTEPYLIINGEQVVHAYENYENAKTGEYVRWITRLTSSGGIVKTFSYKIRYSVTSSKFTVGSTSVNVSSDAHVEDIYGNYASGYSGHAYQIQVTGIFSRNLYFSVDGTESGTINGLTNGGSYSVSIINNDYLSDYYYLVGSGTITNN